MSFVCFEFNECVLINSYLNQEEKIYSDQIRDIFNILHTKLNSFLSPVTVTFANHSKKFRILTVQPGPSGINDHRLGRKMAKFEMFLFSSLESLSPLSTDVLGRALEKVRQWVVTWKTTGHVSVPGPGDSWD